MKDEEKKPIGLSGWQDENENIMSPEKAKKDLPKVTCDCGWRGGVWELLGIDPDEDETLWCPQCGGIGWTYD